MESQPQNPEFRINPKNFHQCIFKICRSVLNNKTKFAYCQFAKFSVLFNFSPKGQQVAHILKISKSSIYFG